MAPVQIVVTHNNGAMPYPRTSETIITVPPLLVTLLEQLVKALERRGY